MSEMASQIRSQIDWRLSAPIMNAGGVSVPGKSHPRLLVQECGVRDRDDQPDERNGVE
jgi:hypothetical protein